MLTKGKWANLMTFSSDILNLKLVQTSSHSSPLFYIVIITVSQTFKLVMYHATDLNNLIEVLSIQNKNSSFRGQNA